MKRALSVVAHGLAVGVMWCALALFFVAGCIEAISVLLRPKRAALPPVTPEPPAPAVYVRDPFIYDATTVGTVQ